MAGRQGVGKFVGHALIARSQGDGAARRHGIARVDHQVEQRRFELVGVDLHQAEVGRKPDLDGGHGAQRLLQEIAQLVDEPPQFDGLRTQFLSSSEGQHALGQRRAALGRLNGVVEKRHDLRIVGDSLAHEIETAEDRRQQIVEVVRHAAGKLSDGFHLLRLDENLAGLLEGRLRLPALREIAGDLRESQKLSVRRPDRVNDDAGPEAGPVLPDTPALVLEFSFRRGGFEGVFRQPGAAILLGVKAREVLAENLRGLVALEAPGPGVPAGHDAVGVEHVNGVVGDVLDEQARPLIARQRRGMTLDQVHAPLNPAWNRPREGACPLLGRRHMSACLPGQTSAGRRRRWRSVPTRNVLRLWAQGRGRAKLSNPPGTRCDKKGAPWRLRAEARARGGERRAAPGLPAGWRIPG